MKVGILGIGSIGQRHCRNLGSLGFTDFVFFDSVKKDLDITGKFVASINEFISEKPELVLICSPTSLHKEHLYSLVEAGIPNIFIEKPLSHSLDGLSEIGKEISKKKIRTMTGCNFRFHPCVSEIKRIIEKGILGKIISARVEAGQYLPDWHPNLDYRERYTSKKELGGGALLDYIHELDYANWLFGDPTEVLAKVGKLSSLEIETEDNAELIVKYKTGIVASIHVDYLQRHYRRYCRVTGELGSTEWEFNSKKVVTRVAGQKDELIFNLNSDFDFNSLYINELKYFVDCIKEKKPNMSDFSEGYTAVKLALLAKDSSETNKFQTVSERVSL